MNRPWLSWSDCLVRKYGKRVYKVAVDAALSCPNRSADGSGGCAFCDGTGAVAVHLRDGDRQKKTSDDILLGRCEDIESQIDRGLRYIRYRYRSELAMLYFQSWSNTNAPARKLKEIYDRALSCAPFVSLIVSTRPDLLPDDTVDLLASYITPEREVWVELGLQSASDRTLEMLGRGHDVACYIDAVSRLKKVGIRVCTHMMILPCLETVSDSLSTIRLINSVKSDAVKIHNLSLVRGTRLLDWYRDFGCWPTLSLRRLVETDARLLASLSPGIMVERLVSEMPDQRLVNPVHFPDKREILDMIASFMNGKGWVQGSLLC